MSSPFDDEEDIASAYPKAAESHRRGLQLAVDDYCTYTESIVVVPDGVVRIGANAFAGHEEITQVVLPHSLESIEANAFSGCSSLAEIAIPDTLTELGPRAFAQCTGLTKVSLPAELSSIAEGTFTGCKSLQEVECGTLKTIGRDAFLGCVGLQDVAVSSLLEQAVSIGRGAFAGCLALTDVHLSPKTVTIGGEAFRGCSGLHSVELPPEVESMGDNLFVGCFSLETIEGAYLYVEEYPDAFPRAFVQECGLVRPRDIKLLQAEYRQAHADEIEELQEMIARTKEQIASLDEELNEEGILRIARKRQMSGRYATLQRRLKEQEDVLDSLEHPPLHAILSKRE